MITGDTFRPDIIIIKDKQLIILESTVGYETNIKKNSIRKSAKYDTPITDPELEIMGERGNIHLIPSNPNIRKIYKHTSRDANV